jgi:hypothetical protein
LTVSVADAVLEPRVAVIVTVVLVVTSAVLTVKFALVWSLLAVTEEGTEATDGLLLDRVIVAPAPGAGSLSWTVPDEPLVPVVAAGFSDTDVTVGGGSTCSVLVTDPVGSVAVIVTSVTAVTVPVVMPTLARYWPAGMTTLAGTGAAEGLLLDRLTVTPPDGAGLFRSGSTVTLLLLAATPGSRFTLDSVGVGTGSTVIVTDIDDEPSVAVNFAAVGVVTLPAVNSTWPESEPAATGTDAGMGMTDWLELLVFTVTPPLGALPLSVM